MRDPLADYRDNSTGEVQIVGGPLDGDTHTSDNPTTFWSYLHDDGTRADREDFTRHPAHGYVHWCGHDINTGELLHAYVHGSVLDRWLDNADGRHPR